MTQLPAFGRAIRHEFAIASDIDFLNNGSFGAPPRVVLAAQQRWREQMEAQPVAFFSDTLPAALRASAARLASFIGARGEDLAFVENATAGMNAVLRSLRFASGDEIVATDHVYGAVRQTLRHVTRDAGPILHEVVTCYPADDPQAIVDAVAAKFGSRTKLLVVDHIASASALRLPLEKLIALARSRGVPVLVDGAHAPGQIALDVPALGADWYVGNCHKWLFAPKGAAFLWASPRAQAGIHPVVISHYYGSGFTSEFDWVGTRDPSAWLSVPDGIDYLERLGVERVRERNHALAIEAATMIARSWKSELGAPPDRFAAMATIRVPDTPETSVAAGRALRARLWREQRIEVPIMSFGGALWARVSAQVFNQTDDYRRLAAVFAR
jgi:isopenicillin-N epimerase